VALSLRRRGPSNFERAADGSMTLVEHLIELRRRLFFAALGVVAGLIVGLFLADPAFQLLIRPYKKLPDAGSLQWLGPADSFTVKLQMALWLGLIIGAPVWLYQLWAFVAPGLHRHERRWAYAFVAVAVPLFATGVVLAYFVVDRSLHFLVTAGVSGAKVQFEASRYLNFVTTMMLLFGAAFEFPLLLLMLNFAGVVTGRRLLSWWRAVVFLCTAFAAVVTPDPGVFGMLLLAACMSVLYFVAVGVALFNDRRRSRRQGEYSDLTDDQISPLEDDRDPVEPGEAVGPPTAVGGPSQVPAPLPIERRYDDFT
jgi:sec-independent protein translocase protein TatC